MKKVFLYIVFSLAFIQVARPQGCFTAERVKVCVDDTVRLTNCDPLSIPTSTRYNYGDTPLTNRVKDTFHVYKAPGIYTVTQFPYRPAGAPPLTKTNYIEVVPAKKPTYDIDICEGKTATLTITDNIDNSYLVTSNGVTTDYPPFTPITFTYPDVTLKTITIDPINTGCLNESVSFYPIDIVKKPDLNSVFITKQDPVNGQLSLKFNAEINQRYIVQQSVNNNSSYANLDTLYQLLGAQNILFNNLNTASNQYCMRLVAFDDCGHSITSEEICSLIASATASNNQNDVSWNAHLPGNVAGYDILRNGTIIGSTSSLSFTDNTVSCGVNYCYQVSARLNSLDASGSPLLSLSAAQCVTAISTNIPPAVQNLNSSVSGSTIELFWDTPAPTVTKYHISRSANGSALIPYASYTSPIVSSYSDNGASVPGNEYCYEVSYTDACGNTSPSSNTSCPIILHVATDNTATLTNNLTWTAYTGPWVPLGYLVQSLDENNNVLKSTNVGLSQSYVDVITSMDVKFVKYRIQVIPNGPSAGIPYSNIIEIKFEGEIYLPNAFTPNGDNSNDEFKAMGKFIKEYKLTIFNRWGEVVFTSDLMDTGWKGDYQGLPALPDAYAYLVEAKDYWDKTITKRGSVTLLK